MVKLKKYEPILFALALLLHLIPVFILTPFVTLDGPVHLYNARLIHDLILLPDPLTSDYYTFNPVIEPNLTGHYLMAFLLTFFSPLITEKILLIGIICGFALGYRKLLLALEPEAGFVTWLIFPLLYNFTFLIGFFNFMIGLSILPYYLAWWLKSHSRSIGLSAYAYGITGLLLLYYSHILIFLLALLLSGIISVFSRENKVITRVLLRLAIISLPALVLTIQYLISHDSRGFHQDIQWLPVTKLFEDIFNSRCIIMYDYALEKRFTRFFTILLLLVTLPALQFRTIQKYQRIGLLWFISGMLLLFMVPDSLASGGIITPRLELWAVISFILFLSTLRIPDRASLPAAFGAIMISALMMTYHYRFQREMSDSARTILEAGKSMKAPSVLLPVNYSGNWLHANLCSYLGAEKKIVVLDNYEADYRLFPIVWKPNRKPSENTGNHAATKTPCLTITAAEQITKHKIDYLSFWYGMPDDKDSCARDISLQIQQLYSTAPLRNGNFTLFTRK